MSDAEPARRATLPSNQTLALPPDVTVDLGRIHLVAAAAVVKIGYTSKHQASLHTSADGMEISLIAAGKNPTGVRGAPVEPWRWLAQGEIHQVRGGKGFQLALSREPVDPLGVDVAQTASV